MKDKEEEGGAKLPKKENWNERVLNGKDNLERKEKMRINKGRKRRKKKVNGECIKENN